MVIEENNNLREENQDLVDELNRFRWAFNRYDQLINNLLIVLREKFPIFLVINNFFLILSKF